MDSLTPYRVVEDFEKALCEYTGALHAVTVNSCTSALLLAVRSCATSNADVDIPKRTYVGVPMSVIHAGARVRFVEKNWLGAYRLNPLPVWDSARWFTRDLFPKLVETQGMVCVSFHASKTLGLEQGGAILHNFPEPFDLRLRRMRLDGRAPGVAVVDDEIQETGYHVPMIPSVAAAGLLRLSTMMHREFAPLPVDDYPDLSKMPVFQRNPRIMQWPGQ